jgi:hypothetical protein
VKLQAPKKKKPSVDCTLEKMEKFVPNLPSAAILKATNSLFVYISEISMKKKETLKTLNGMYRLRQFLGQQILN